MLLIFVAQFIACGRISSNDFRISVCQIIINNQIFRTLNEWEKKTHNTHSQTIRYVKQKKATNWCHIWIFGSEKKNHQGSLSRTLFCSRSDGRKWTNEFAVGSSNRTRINLWRTKQKTWFRYKIWKCLFLYIWMQNERER